MLFFQAEDGIRDLVRSRGLGDVYKRQGKAQPAITQMLNRLEANGFITREQNKEDKRKREAVSYTHLTLPTSDLV